MATSSALRNHKLRDAKPLPVETVLGAVSETRPGAAHSVVRGLCYMFARSSLTVLLK